MRRGIIPLLASEITELNSFIPLIENPEPMLLQKIQTAVAAPQPEQTIEFSSDEIEQILDVLPAPMESTESLKTLRMKLTTFLQSLH